jgi:hypothetical protein
MYNGWKKKHALKFQAVKLTNGITLDLWGRRSDCWLLQESNIDDRLTDAQLGDPVQYKVSYPDCCSHVTRGYKGNEITNEQKLTTPL